MVRFQLDLIRFRPIELSQGQICYDVLDGRNLEKEFKKSEKQKVAFYNTSAWAKTTLTYQSKLQKMAIRKMERKSIKKVSMAAK